MYHINSDLNKDGRASPGVVRTDRKTTAKGTYGYHNGCKGNTAVYVVPTTALNIQSKYCHGRGKRAFTAMAGICSALLPAEKH